MPLIARGAGSGDVVTCVAHGAPGPGSDPCGKDLVLPLTNLCSPTVFVADVGAVRNGDLMMAHPRHYSTPLCAPHTPPCVTYSPNVYANDLEIARQGDTYFEVNNHIITQVTQTTVFAN